MLKKKRGRPKGSTIKKQSTFNAKEIYYTKTYEDLLSYNGKTIVFRGGAGSGKSFGILQYIIQCLLMYDGIRILIARKNYTSLKASTVSDFWKIIDSMTLRNYFHETKSPIHEVSCGKSYLRFASLRDIENVRSDSFNLIFVEEADTIKFSDFLTLQTRLRNPILDWKFNLYDENDNTLFRNKIIVAFNPLSPYGWIPKLVNKKIPDLIEFKSNYKDNPFLSNDYINDLENKKYISKEIYNIYALGEYGVPEGLVFSTNWKQVENHANKTNSESKEVFFGIDFGIAAPTAVTKVICSGNDVYVEEMLYKSHIDTLELIEFLKSIIPEEKRSNVKLYCDNEAADAISIIKKSGFYAIPCTKGPGSVLEGIRYMQSCFFMVDSESTNVIKEFTTYCWKKDKNDNFIDEPAGIADHALDSIRYVLYSRFKAQSNKVLVGGVDNTPPRNNDMWR